MHCFLIKTIKKRQIIFFLIILFTQFRENLFWSQETLIKHVFFKKTASTHTFTFQPWYFITSRSRWHIFLDLDQIWTWSEQFAIPSERHPWRHWSVISGLLPDSGSIRPQPREGLDAILCVTAHIANHTNGGLWQPLLKQKNPAYERHWISRPMRI